MTEVNGALINEIEDAKDNAKLVEEAGIKNQVKTDYTRAKIDNLRVSADPPDLDADERKKRVKKLAGAISHSLRTNGEINVRSFGNAAIGKAAKALAIARDYVKATHPKLQLSFSPGFIETEIEGNKLTGISFFAFTNELPQPVVDKDLEKVEIKLFVKADPKDIDPEERRLAVRKLAGAITHAVEEKKECIVRCFGNAAIGKASKALAIARGFTATRGPDLYCWSSFIVADMQGSERTGICFYTYSNE